MHRDLYISLKTNIYVPQVSLYMDKFAGVCQSVLHDCKLTFLQIICDHDLFVEMPGRDPSDRYFFFLCSFFVEIFYLQWLLSVDAYTVSFSKFSCRF